MNDIRGKSILTEERLSDIPYRPLTDREWTVLQLIAAGLSNQEIADRLTLSLTTVKWYNRQIFNKLGATNRTEAVAIGVQCGLIKIDSPEFALDRPLPTPITPLLGREKEVGEVISLLHDSSIRLVTILGPGGVGKTHLALEVAWQIPSPVRFVALEGVGAPSDLIPAVAEAIGFRLNGHLDPSRQLLIGLRKHELLLVLDNFDHLLAAGRFVSDLLAAAPGLKIMTTSRERLNLRAETVFSLGGLAYPEEPHRYQDCPAFHLFVRATRGSQPAFQPQGDDLTHINRICQLVEGIPLALELAASWMDVLTPRHIADEIVASIAVLQSNLRDVPERHRSMESVFEHSWRLLSEEERTVFKKLAVFRGGFGWAAAEQVAGASLFTLSTLVDKSLVVRIGPDRFKLHELLRQFAEEKLRSDRNEYTQTLHLHCQHYASLMRHHERNLKTDLSSISQSMMGIEKDFDNILSGWHRALDEPFISEIGNYAYSMTFLFELRGLYILGAHTFEQAFRLLQTHADQVSAVDRLRIICNYGWMLRGLSRYLEAQQVLQMAVDLTEILDGADAADVAMVFILLAWVAHANGDSALVKWYLQQGLALCQKTNYAFGEGLHDVMLAEIEYDEGCFDLAYRLHRNMLLRHEQAQHIVGILYSLGFLGCTCCALGELESARAYLQRGLALQRDLLVQWNFQAVDPLHVTLIGIAALYAQSGQPEAALELLAILLHHPQRGGDSERKASVLLTQVRSRLPVEHVHAVLEQAQQGRLSSRYLESQFTVDTELIDRLSQLLEGVSVPANVGVRNELQPE